MKDEKYLQFLRQSKCALCGFESSWQQNEPHHCGRYGTAKRSHDELCASLCRSCHIEVHKHPKRYKQQLIEIAERQYKEYLNKGD